MKKRRRLKQIESLHDRLTAFAAQTREHASTLPPRREQDDLMKKTRQADVASNLDQWVNSPGLQPSI